MESVDIATPISKYHVAHLSLQWAGSDSLISITLLSSDNRTQISHSYTGVTAETMIKQLNKANLSTKSLQLRIMERLVLDGVIVGTISGAPD